MTYRSMPRFDISVAMATYNGAEHIREQLDSLASQSLLPAELVVTDDGSTDATLEIVEDFTRTAPFPVRVIRNESRLGYADNFLKGASLCSATLVAFCDQDDHWRDRKLEVCSGYFHDETVALVVHSGTVWTGKAETSRRYPAFGSVRINEAGSLDPFLLIPGFSMVFRQQLLGLTDNADRPNCMFGLRNGSTMAHDGWIWLLATSTSRVALLPDNLTLYRQHVSNAVGAPLKRNLARKLRESLNAREYLSMARLESKAADILAGISKRDDVDGPTVAQVAARLRFRSRLHRYRDTLYRLDSGLLRRIASFVRILVLGGYLPDRRRIKIGPNSAVKDLLFGVTGFYKRLAS